MMKKAFVWDPVMRSSAMKYDPCVVFDGNICKIKCEDCKITLIADRFLGEEFQREILGLKVVHGINPTYNRDKLTKLKCLLGIKAIQFYYD